MGLENPFGVLTGHIPACSHENPCILIQLLFTKKFIKKPSITGIHISDPNKSPIPTTHGGSIIKLPSGALTTTYERHNIDRVNLSTNLTDAKQWDDDHTLTISDWDNSSSADYVDFSTAGRYSVTYTMEDVNNVETTEEIVITVKDTVAPTLYNVRLQSDNNTPFDDNSTWARVGDKVTLSFKSSEKLQNDVVVTMASGGTAVKNSITSADVVNNTDVGTMDTWMELHSYSYITHEDDVNGEITFTPQLQHITSSLSNAALLSYHNSCII